MKRSCLVFALVIGAMYTDMSLGISATAQPPSQDSLTHKTQEHQIDVIQTQEHRIDIIQRRQDRATPQFLHEALKEVPEQPSEGRRALGMAWRLFTRGDYRRARDLFTAFVSDSDPATKWEATYGLAMCYAKLKDRRAIPLLQELLDRGEPMSKDRRTQLAIELHNLGGFAEAERYFAELLERR